MQIFPAIDFPIITDSQIWAIILACVMMLADIAVGTIAAVLNNNVQSSKMREGIVHKTLMLIVIAISYILGVGLNHVTGFELQVPSVEVVCGYIIVMELASVFENIGKGWPEFTDTALFRIFSNKDDELDENGRY